MADNRKAIAGLALGFTEAFQRAKREKSDKELRDLKLKEIKSAMEFADKQRDAQDTVFQQMNPHEGPPRSFADIIADPRGQALLWRSGLLGTPDFLREQRLSQGQELLQKFLGNGESGDNELFDKADPFSTAAALQSGDLGKLRLSELDKPLSPAELINIPGAEPGMTMRDIRDKGLKPQKESELKIEQKLRPAKQIVSELGDVVNRVFTEDDFFARVKKGFKNAPENLLRQNPDIVFLMDFESRLAPLVKALGEAGALAEGDVLRAQKNIPQLFPIPDTKEVAQAKVKSLKKLIEAGVQNLENQQSSLPADEEARYQELLKKFEAKND